MLGEIKMTDFNQLQMMLNNVQSQISAVSNLITNQPKMQYPDVSSMIRSAVQAELNRNQKQVPAILQQNNQQPNNLLQQVQGNFLQSIGTIFTTEEQEYMSNPSHLLRVPEFMNSKEGKDLVAMFMESFKSFIGNK
jgi:hypothetical protein